MCRSCYHGDCPKRCPDDMCRNGLECEDADFGDDADDDTLDDYEEPMA